MDPQLQQYIATAKTAGQTDEQVKQALLQAGWSQAQVNEAFGIPSQNTPPPPPPQSGAPQNSTPPMSDNKVMAIISYISILWVIPLVTNAKNDPFVKFHIKQGITLSVAGLVAFVVSMIPILGWMLSPLLMLGLLVLMVMGILNVVNGKQTPLPIIGSFSSNLHF